MKHDTRSPAHSFLKVFLCSPALSLDHSGFASRRHLGFLSLPHPSLLDQRLNPLWIRPRNAYANTERERQCLHYLAHSLSLLHLSFHAADLRLDAHGDFSSAQASCALPRSAPVIDETASLLARTSNSASNSLLVTSPSDRLCGLGVAANELFLASSLVAATCECRSPLARAGVATSPEYSRCDGDGVAHNGTVRERG